MKRRNPFSFLLALALPLAAVAVTAPALAQSAPPAQAAPAAARVSIDGRFQRYVLNPRGHVVGLLMHDGTVVYLHRHKAAGAVETLKPFDALHIEGGAVKTPTGTVILRPVVSQNGSVIFDGSKHRARGEHKHERDGARHAKDRPALAPVTAAGRVQAIVSTPRGHVATVLLDDGTSASGFGLDTVRLKIGDRVTVSGKGGTYTQGKALRIETITLPSGETKTLPKAPKHAGRRHRGQKQAPV
jgi:hypothetical protein